LAHKIVIMQPEMKVGDRPSEGNNPQPINAGEPVCWLHLVCDSCGALIEKAGDPHRPGCDAGEVRGDP
jgi:hypothetical protein